MPRSTRLHVSLETLPAVLASSMICVLRARGMEVSPDLVGEIARNQSQALMIFEVEQPESDDDVATDRSDAEWIEHDPPKLTARDCYDGACDDRRRADYDERHLETIRGAGL